MNYTTRGGVTLRVGRIPRQRIDQFIVEHPVPEIPTRQAEAFGGVIEELPVLDDPAYLRELGGYYAQLGYDQVELIADAVEIEGEQAMEELEDMLRLGLLLDNDKATLLHVVLADDTDMAEVVGSVFYQSIVTEKGIAEAAAMFGVMWRDRSILAWHLPKAHGLHNQIFEDRAAARFSGYGWMEFCELPGSEQSAAVAFYRVSKRLEWLQTMDHK